MLQVACAWLFAMEMPTFSPEAAFPVSQRPKSPRKTGAHHLAAIEGKRKETAPGSRLLAAAAASVLSLHLPTNTQMCGCICTEMMNNNSRGKRSRRESAGEKEAFAYRGERNRISSESEAWKEAKALAKGTCLGKAGRKQPPVKTRQGRGKGFKETELRRDKTKFLQPIQKGGDGESRSPTCGCRVGMTARNVGCHSFFSPLFLQNQEWVHACIQPLIPMGLAHTAWVFAEGPSHG